MSRMMIIAIIRGSLSDPPAVLTAHLVAYMTEYIRLLRFLNLFLILTDIYSDPRELHVHLCKCRSHLVLPYRPCLRLLASCLPGSHLLLVHLFIHLIQEFLYRILLV